MVICKKCSKQILSSKIYQCDSCFFHYHPSCDELLKLKKTDIDNGKQKFICCRCHEQNSIQSPITMDNELNNVGDAWNAIKREISDLRSSHDNMVKFLNDQLANQNVVLDNITSKCEKLAEMETAIQTNSTDINNLKVDNAAIRLELLTVSNKCDLLERRINSNKSLIYGIPSTVNEHLLEVLQLICDKIKFVFNNNNINSIYREKSKSTTKAIVVDWSNQILKQQFRVLSTQNKDILKLFKMKDHNCNITITDFLPKHKRMLLHEAKSLLKSVQFNFKFVWATNGIILAKKDENSQIIEITSSSDLDRIKNTLI